MKKIMDFVDEHFIWGWAIWVAVLAGFLFLLGKFLGWQVTPLIYFVIPGMSYPIVTIVIMACQDNNSPDLLNDQERHRKL